MGKGRKVLSRPARTLRQCLQETALIASEQDCLVLGDNLLLFIHGTRVNKGLTQPVQTETILFSCCKSGAESQSSPFLQMFWARYSCQYILLSDTISS